MKNWVDAIFILASLISFIRGYKAGFLTSILSFVGYVGGGLLGLTLGLHYFHSHGISRVFLLFLAVTIASSLGEAILKSIGKLFHSKLLFGPFKWVDSLLGAAFSILSTLVALLIFCHLLLITPWSWAARNIPQSTIYTKLNAQAPSIISNLTKRAQASIR